MTTFSDIFGGSSVQPADVGFRAVALSASITTVWPAFATTGNELARIMKVTPSVGSLTVTLPDATLASQGIDVLFDNSGAFTFTVLDASGNSVATLTAGQVKYLYLSGNSTAAGTWRVTLFGTGSSTLDASQLSGFGLKALNNTLNAAPVLTSVSGNTVVVPDDRAKVFLWTGGVGTLTLPTTAGSTSDFVIEVRNQGTGSLTLAPVGGSLIDGAASILLANNEACFVHMGASDWYTVGRGRNTAFNFTHLNKSVTGGAATLTLTEASNVVQTYTGILTSNETISLPAVVQVYYISNNTTGAYSLTFKCVTGGSASITLTQNQAMILFCDGNTVINNNTASVAGITSLLFAAGSAAAPSFAMSTSGNGFYAPGTNQMGMAINGVAAGLWTATGYKTFGSGAMALEVVSSASSAQANIDRPAGQVGSAVWRTAGYDRWKFNADATAEGGANAGTNFNLSSYDDTGALLGTAFTVNRATRVITFTQPPVMDLSSGTVNGFAAGYLTLPQNSKSADYTCVLSDAGKHIFHPTADVTGRTFTIPANASVAYPIGTTITFINQHGAGYINIAITSDAMYFAVSGTTGTRVLATSGIATAVKVTATEWLISGTGLS